MGVDAAIQLRSGAAPGMEETAFLGNSYGPVVSPLRAAALSDPLELLTEPRLHTRTWPQAWPNWAKAAKIGLRAPAVERNFDHFSHALEAAAAGLGAAVAPWTFVADDVEAGRLAAPLGFLKFPERVTLIRPSGRANPAIDSFALWLLEQGQRMPPPPKAVKTAS